MTSMTWEHDKHVHCILGYAVPVCNDQGQQAGN
jgi:hypothetical protein